VTQQVITVVVADDHPMYRDGLSAALTRRDEFQLVGEYGDGHAARREIERLAPDVAVIDLRLPGIDGVSIVRELAAAQVVTRALMLSASTDAADVYAALKAGASGYLAKDADRQRICDAVAAVAGGETVLPPELHAGLADQIRSSAPETDNLLSKREHGVLELTAQGRSAREIGAELYLSPATVKSHLQSIYSKLGVSDRAAAVAEAMRRKLLS
jgi:two-component system, NarL family, nitrate/nitrite response regulator NarL